MVRNLLAVLLFAASALLAQFDPDSAHVNLYFPQLADGGAAAQRWQTSIILQNPHPSLAAGVLLTIRGNDGQPLALDFGAGPTATANFSIPAGGTRILRSMAASPQLVTGWAVLNATLPIHGTVLFRAIESGIPRVDIAAAPTLPTPLYRSFANADLGIAVGNPYSDVPLTVQVRAMDHNGVQVGSSQVTVPALGHTSFNLRNLISTLPGGYVGTVELSTRAPLNLVAWTLNAQDNVLSPLPSGAARWPISHHDRIQLAYWKVINAMRAATAGMPGLDPFSPLVRLVFDPSSTINASASSDNTLTVSYALSELISDSPSEMGFVIGHELGHIIQFRKGVTTFNQNPELDADAWGMLFNLMAGFDPYAGAGALAKLSMASGTAGLVDQQLAEHFDVHRSTNTRLQSMYELLQYICVTSDFRSFCTQYKSMIHPHFPPSSPLSLPVPAPPASDTDRMLRALPAPTKEPRIE